MPTITTPTTAKFSQGDTTSKPATEKSNTPTTMATTPSTRVNTLAELGVSASSTQLFSFSDTPSLVSTEPKSNSTSVTASSSRHPLLHKFSLRTTLNVTPSVVRAVSWTQSTNGILASQVVNSSASPSNSSNYDTDDKASQDFFEEPSNVALTLTIGTVSALGLTIFVCTVKKEL